MNNIIFVITNEIMHCNYNDTEIKCKGYSYCYDEEANELKRKDTIIKFPKPKSISTNKEIKNEVNKYISDINNGLEINRKYAFKKMGLCEGTFDIIDRYFKWRAKTYLNENISIKINFFNQSSSIDDLYADSTSNNKRGKIKRVKNK